MLANLTGEKRTVKSFHLCSSSPLYSILSFSQAQAQQVGKWVTLFVIIAFCFQGDWVYTFRDRWHCAWGWNEDKMHHLTATCGCTAKGVWHKMWNFTIHFKVGIHSQLKRSVFLSGRVALNHHFKHLPSLCNKLSLIYLSVNATASARHLRLWSSNSNQIWRLLRCICITSPAFMDCQLPIMGSSWKADRKWQLWKNCGYWCLSGRAASFQRTIRAKFWGKELRLSLSSWQFTTWKSANWTNV